MICDKCGSSVAEVTKDLWCMYKVIDGKVENRMVHPDLISNESGVEIATINKNGVDELWYDSPPAAKAEAAGIAEADRALAELAKPKEKKSNGNGSKHNRHRS